MTWYGKLTLAFLYPKQVLYQKLDINFGYRFGF